MGKTFNASVDWLGMVENPDQDADPSVNGGKAQKGGDYPTQADIDQFHALNNENYLLQQRQAVGDNVNTLLEHNVDMWRPDVSRYEKLNPLKDCWYDNTCVEAVKNGYKWAGYDSGIPDNVYDNKTFFKNYKDYGFDLIDIKDVSDIKKGDVLQYYTDAAQHDFSENHWTDRRILGIDDDNPVLDIPENQYHMGIYMGDGMYWGDGSKDEPALVADIYKHKDGSSKDKFRVFRKKKADYISKKQDGGGLTTQDSLWVTEVNKLADLYNNYLDRNTFMYRGMPLFRESDDIKEAKNLLIAYNEIAPENFRMDDVYLTRELSDLEQFPIAQKFNTKGGVQSSVQSSVPKRKKEKLIKLPSRSIEQIPTPEMEGLKKVLPYELTKNNTEYFTVEKQGTATHTYPKGEDGKVLIRLKDKPGRTVWSGSQAEFQEKYGDFLERGDKNRLYLNKQYGGSLPKAQNGWSFSDWGHGILDAAGLWPGVGEIADGVNALWYAAEGDKTNAALSTAAMVPFFGWGATTAKASNKINKAIKATNATTDVVKNVTPKWSKGVTHYGDAGAEGIQGALTGMKNTGKYLDDINFDASTLINKNVVNHGTVHGRQVVEVALPNGQTQLFYKSSGLAGKKGAGAAGTTEALWQPFGGHATTNIGGNNVDNWFIKDAGYEDFYGSNSFRDISGNLDRIAAEEGWDMSGQILKSKQKYGGSLPKAQDGTETERQKYIQFALDTESGYHYIRNKDSAVKKLGSDGKWDGKTYYKIYEDGKYYPHYVGDEKRATIGHGHAPVDRDILDEYKDGIDETQALDLLGEDIDEKLRLSEIYYNQRFGDNKWDDLTESEQFMLNDYTFNVRGGFHKTFKNFAKAIHDKDFKSAKKEYKRALGERNVIFMDRYLKPWMDIQQEKTTVAPPLNEMVLPTGTHLMDMTKPQKKETSWWRGEEGWIPDELELPWFMDGAPINARGSSSSSATEIPDGSAAENATMSRSAMDPMPSLNNDLTINDNLALSNTISDLSEETTIAKYGGQYMWGLDLRSTKAQAGKEVKSDDIYANDRYSQSAAKYKKMLPKYQNEGQVNYRSSVPKTDNYTLVAPTLPEVEVVGKDTRNWLKRNYQDYISPIGHGALDVLGMIPAAGELADGINAAWYAAEGNKVDAALSTAAMIPFAGWAATTGKWGKNTIKALNKATPGGGDMYLQMKRINDIGKADVSVKHGYKNNRAKKLGVPQSDRKIKKMIKKNPEQAQKLIDTWNTKYGSWSPNRELVDGKIQLLPGGKTDAISSKINFLDNVKLRVSDDAVSGLNYYGVGNRLPGVHAENLLSYTSKLGDQGTTSLYRYGESPFNASGLGNNFSSQPKSGWFSADPLDPYRYSDYRQLGKDGKVFKIDVENQLLNEIYRGGPQQGSLFNSGTQFKEFDVPDWMIEISNKTDLGSLSDYKNYLKTLKKYGGQK